MKHRAKTARWRIYIIGDELAFDVIRRWTSCVGANLRHFASSNDFLAAAPRLGKGCVVLDLDSKDSPEIIASLRRSAAAECVIAQTGDKDVRIAIAAMRLGAVDVLVKPYGEEALVEALGHGDSGVRSVSQADVTGPLARLSERESDVLRGLVRGLTNKAIGAELGISFRTVEIHRARLMRKLGVTSLSALLDIAFQHRDALVREDHL
jgi:two-component system response regulator FixJ